MACHPHIGNDDGDNAERSDDVERDAPRNAGDDACSDGAHKRAPELK